MKKNILCGLLFYLAWQGCQSPNSNNNGVSSIDVSRFQSIKTIHTDGEPIYLIVGTSQAIVRQEPKLEAPELLRLQKGDTLLYTNELTDNTLQLKIEGIDYDEPWLKVIGKGNKMGWIYGGNVRFVNLDNAQLVDLVLDKRVRSVFGGNWSAQLHQYRKELADLQTPLMFQLAYERGDIFRDSLELKINALAQKNGLDSLPDFFWLNDVFSGFLVHWIEPQQRYFLFRDYRYWLQKATQSPDLYDDTFIQFYLTIYSSDSIEYYFADWQMPLSDTSACSLLGRGIHQHLLMKIDTILLENKTFQPFLMKTKRAILDDIVLQKNYWMPLANIQTELQAILKNPPTYLTISEKIELQTKLKLFNDCMLNKITVNLSEN